MRFLCLLLLCSLAMAQASAGDSRNRDLPATDTHFQPKTYTSLAAWKARKADLRRQILFAAGLFPMPAKTPLNAQVFGRIERDGYTVEKVLLETMPGYYLGGNLYRPAGEGPFPAIAQPHGHWSYGRLENQPLSSPQTLAANLAKLGFLVLSYDMVGYNDTRQTPHRFSDPDQELWSFTSMGLQLWNSIRVVDYLAGRSDVDRERIGMTGASGGGAQTFLLAAVDDRIAASAPVNVVSAIMQGPCVCENAPGLRIGTYNVEITAMMAPRPQLIVAATGDWTRNVPKEEFPAVRRIYELYGKSELVESVQFDAPHNFNADSRTAVYRFFTKRLQGRGDSDAIMESKTEIEDLSDLMVFHGRPFPDNALDFAGLFTQWRGMVRAQTLAITDEAQLRDALRLAIKASWPAAVETINEGGRLFLTRAGAGDRIPAVWRPGTGPPVLIVHPRGAAAARELPAARKLLAAGRAVLLIDAFQTGSATAERDESHQYFLTFNRARGANRVQDILTALAFLRQAQPGTPELIGTGDAAIWSLFAAALVPGELHLTADLEGFHGSDQEFLERFFVPGIQRAGGLAPALRLTRDKR